METIQMIRNGNLEIDEIISPGSTGNVMRAYITYEGKQIPITIKESMYYSKETLLIHFDKLYQHTL